MQQIDHRVIKLVVGLIAVCLAIFMQTISGTMLHSISEAYHYQSRDWFVGLLFVEAALFLSFSGEDRRERVLTIVASVLATIVAVVPCECNRVHGVWSALHFPAATGLFIILGYFCWRFRRTAMSKVERYPQAQRRVYVYNVCFAGMLGCGLMALAYVVARDFIDHTFPDYVFFMEALGLVSFGVSWLAASRVWPWITDSRERFSIPKGRAPEDADARVVAPR